ncbi:MAG: S1 RNA-binding domain-containing protein [Candidatus Izemoplasmatales bacterium]
MDKGDLVKGRITGIKSYGAFVKLDGDVDGLVHISEVSDGFVRRIDDFFKVGDVVELEVLGFTEEGKVSLSYKRANRAHRKKYVTIVLKSGFEPLGEMLPIWIARHRKGGG